MKSLIDKINARGHTVSLHQFQGLGGRWHAEANPRGKTAGSVSAFGDAAEGALAALLDKLDTPASLLGPAVDPFAFENEEDPLA